MALKIPKYAWMAIHLLTAISLFLCFIADILYLAWTSSSWKISSGYKTDKQHYGVNMGFYLNISVLCWLLTSIIFAVLEIGFTFSIGFFNKFRIGFVRGAAYIILGVAELGVCADFGIAAGSLIIICGAISLLIDFLALANVADNEE